MARAKGLAISVQRKLRTCAAMMWVSMVRQSAGLSSGANRHTYPAAIGIKIDNSARGMPRAMLFVHVMLPSAARAGTRSAATPIHCCLFMRGAYLRGFMESAMPASVADLHASKQRRAENDQCFSGFVGVRGRSVARGVGKASKDTLPARGDEPGFRNTQFNTAENCVCVDYCFVFQHVSVAQIQFDAAKNGLQAATTKFAAVQAFFDAAKKCVLVESVARIGLALRQGRHCPACLNRAPHGHCAARNEEQRPELAPGEGTDSEVAQLQEDAKQENNHTPKPRIPAGKLRDAQENQG